MIEALLGAQKLDLKSMIFSGGEVHPKLAPAKIHTDPKSVGLNIMAIIKSSDDIMQLLLVTDALRRMYPLAARTNLLMPYVPYARQDRVMVEGEALSIKVFCDLINAQNYDTVTIWDPHSDVTSALLNRVMVVEQQSFLWAIPGVSQEKTILVAPDAGAIKKVSKAATVLRLTTVVRADKIRDVTTGAITGTTAYTDHVGDKDFLILDDICDGGRTFIELAKFLKTKTTGEINLFVTHGIFSKGFEELSQVLDHVYTANCFIPIPEQYKGFVIPV